MPKVLNKRGTRTQLNTAAAENQLSAGEVYLITDENRLAVGLTTSTYETYAKASEAGGVSDYSDLTNTPPLTKSINFFGVLEPTAGTAKFAFPQAVTITKAYAVVGVASTSIISAILYKNGQSFATLTIDANAAKSSVVILTEAISANDFLTADIAAASGGENLILILEYK